MTSRRVVVAGVCPANVTVADMERMTVPAVGYGCELVDDCAGMTTFVTVSPAARLAVNAPALVLPVVDSVPDDVPFTVRLALPGARPVTVWLLFSLTVLVLVSIDV